MACNSSSAFWSGCWIVYQQRHAENKNSDSSLLKTVERFISLVLLLVINLENKAQNQSQTYWFLVWWTTTKNKYEFCKLSLYNTKIILFRPHYDPIDPYIMAVSVISAVRQAARNPEHLVMLESWTFYYQSSINDQTLHRELDKVFKVKNSTRSEEGK